MKKRELLAGLAGIAVAIGVAGFIIGDPRAAESHQDSDRPDRIRWVNVIIDMPPEESPLRLVTAYPISPDPNATRSPDLYFSVYITGPRVTSPDGQVLPSPEIIINAETGELVKDELSAVYPAEVEALLASVVVDTSLPKAWPFSDEPPPDRTSSWAGIVYPVPDPTSAITATPIFNFCTRPEPACYGESVVVQFGWSAMHITPDGKVVSYDRVAPEHREAFERFAAAVRVSSARGDATSQN